MDEIIKTGDRLYYELNPDSKMDVPSSFYEKVGELYLKYLESELVIPFYNYCKSTIV